MSKRNGDWWCPKCEFTVWGSKPKCLKCGFVKPEDLSLNTPVQNIEKRKVDYWKPGNIDPKWDDAGPYSFLKGGYDGEKLIDEPQNLIYPHCGCKGLDNCPKRHHPTSCGCYTCRGKPHKW